MLGPLVSFAAGCFFVCWPARFRPGVALGGNGRILPARGWLYPDGPLLFADEDGTARLFPPRG